MSVLGYLRAAIGTPYLWGGAGPRGYDCSGLIWAAYRSQGYRIPRTTQEQIRAGQAVSLRNLRPGDLIFPNSGHVGVYLGNGKVESAPHTGAKVHVTDVRSWLGPSTVARRFVKGGLKGGVDIPAQYASPQVRQQFFAPDQHAATMTALQQVKPVTVTPQPMSLQAPQNVLAGFAPAPPDPPPLTAPTSLFRQSADQAGGQLDAIRKRLVSI